MRIIPDKMPVETIDLYIKEFESVSKNREKNPNRFYTRGVFMLRLRESIEDRLNVGESMQRGKVWTQPMEDLWLQLLNRQEQISNLLDGEGADLIHAAKVIFDAEVQSD